MTTEHKNTLAADEMEDHYGAAAYQTLDSRTMTQSSQGMIGGRATVLGPNQYSNIQGITVGDFMAKRKLNYSQNGMRTINQVDRVNPGFMHPLDMRLPEQKLPTKYRVVNKKHLKLRGGTPQRE